jgi:hypothetical protein
MLVFVQPFGLNSPGGGSRILRALLEDTSIPFLSICTSPEAPPVTSIGQELHLPIRPHLGRIEYTRLSNILTIFAYPFIGSFKQKLALICCQNQATAIHAIAHDLSFGYAYQVAQQLGLPYYLSVHDDLKYVLQYRIECKEAMARMSEVWQGAKERFVISDELGKEYCHRYGHQSYTIVTDGLKQIPSQAKPRTKKSLRIYFMGLFHVSYATNLKALLQALEFLQTLQPDWHLSLTCRCGFISPDVLANRFPVTLLPFASEQEVMDDLEQADLVYLPLPFGEEHECFIRYSLSTKMITYLGSGLPILYHGPAEAAASKLLNQYQAAILLNSLDPQSIAERLIEAVNQTEVITQNALNLACNQFKLSQQKHKFWSAFNEIKG